jgi:glycosyltransferase involved in cell wall biosynthesis
MYKNKRVSVILPVYNEEENIRSAIEGFFASYAVDEVVAVDNNSTDKSAEEIKKTKAVYLHESQQGYGAAIQTGMREAAGDLLVTVEPDGTFVPDDIRKLLIYSDDFEAVFGTRTSRALIWSGAYMPYPVRLGNVLAAKLLEFLFNGPSLTDVGCTYKLINRNAYEKIKDNFFVRGSHFSVEFMIRVLQKRIRCVEIPVHYKKRAGISKITGSMLRAAKLGMRMIVFILKERLL